MVGRVVSTKMEKTAVVIVERRKKHPLYNKSFLRTKKYLVDDPFKVKDGDIVVIEKIQPMSKRKHWRIMKVLGADFVSLQEAELKIGAAEAIAEVLPEEVEKPASAEAMVGKGESLEETVEAPKEEAPVKKKAAKKPKEKVVEEKKPEEKADIKTKKGRKQ